MFMLQVAFLSADDKRGGSNILGLVNSATSKWPLCACFVHLRLRGLGIGSNKKQRQRAALLALARRVRVYRVIWPMCLNDFEC